MAEIIHCPCGKPIECARTDVLETLRCPHCRLEMALDLSADETPRRRGYLTIVEGPERKGELLLIPVGPALTIGARSDCWLDLPDASVAAVHCVAHLAGAGDETLQIHRHGAAPGDSPMATLRSGQALRVGAFVLRYHIGPIVPLVAMGSVVRAVAPPENAGPTMRRVGISGQGGSRVLRDRFILARLGLLVVLGVAGAINLFRLARAEQLGTLRAALLLVPPVALMILSRRIGLGRTAWNIGLVSGVAAGAILFAVLKQPVMAAGMALLACGVGLATPRRVGDAQALFAITLLILAAVMVGISFGVP